VRKRRKRRTSKPWRIPWMGLFHYLFMPVGGTWLVVLLLLVMHIYVGTGLDWKASTLRGI
jgi:uncharacterized membrane protein